MDLLEMGGGLGVGEFSLGVSHINQVQSNRLKTFQLDNLMER